MSWVRESPTPAVAAKLGADCLPWLYPGPALASSALALDIRAVASSARAFPELRLTILKPSSVIPCNAHTRGELYWGIANTKLERKLLMGRWSYRLVAIGCLWKGV